MDLLSDFNKFTIKNVTVAIIASIIIFNLLTVFIQDIVTPLFLTYTDPDSNLDKLNITLNNRNVIYIGSFIKQFIIGIIILVILSQLDKLKW